MSKAEFDLGLIGVGSIAAAIVKGIMKADEFAAVLLSPRGAAVSAALAARFSSVKVASDNQAVIDQCRIVLVCVRPRDAYTVLSDLRFRPEQTVISAMAGVSLSTLRMLAAPAPVCRSIPLPAIAEWLGQTPLFPALPAALALFDRLGGAIEVADEAQFDAFCTVTATISAHVTYLATIAAWLTEQGVERADADCYVAGVFSALDLAPSTAEPLSDLARHHATPGGINEAFDADLASAGITNAVRRGLERIRARLVNQS